MQHIMSSAVTARESGASPMDAQLQMQNQMMQEMAPVMQLGPLIWIVQIVGLFARGVLVAAVLRAVLEPQNKGFFYLRVGMQELWQALLGLVMALLFGAMMFGAVIVGAILVAILAAVLGKAAFAGVFLVGLCIAIAFVFVALRLSLAPALTFHDRTFRLFESWSLTRGHTGALFAIVLILIVMIWVIEIIIGGIGMAYFFATGGDMFRSLVNHNSSNDPAVAMQFIQDFWSRLTPFMIGAAVIVSLLTGALTAIFLAPFATVYQQLTAGAAAPSVSTV
jgi:MFS family permease